MRMKFAELPVGEFYNHATVAHMHPNELCLSVKEWKSSIEILFQKFPNYIHCSSWSRYLLLYFRCRKLKFPQYIIITIRLVSYVILSNLLFFCEYPLNKPFDFIGILLKIIIFTMKFVVLSTKKKTKFQAKISISNSLL